MCVHFRRSIFNSPPSEIQNSSCYPPVIWNNLIFAGNSFYIAVHQVWGMNHEVVHVFIESITYGITTTIVLHRVTSLLRTDPVSWTLLKYFGGFIILNKNKKFTMEGISLITYQFQFQQIRKYRHSDVFYSIAYIQFMLVFCFYLATFLKLCRQVIMNFISFQYIPFFSGNSHK